MPRSNTLTPASVSPHHRLFPVGPVVGTSGPLLRTGEADVRAVVHDNSTWVQQSTAQYRKNCLERLPGPVSHHRRLRGSRLSLITGFHLTTTLHPTTTLHFTTTRECQPPVDPLPTETRQPNSNKPTQHSHHYPYTLLFI